jgi:hypothetical protein
MADPKGELTRVDTDANEAFAVTRVKNLVQAVLENKERTQLAGQVVQVADPVADPVVTSLYVPAPHAVQGPPGVPALTP